MKKSVYLLLSFVFGLSNVNADIITYYSGYQNAANPYPAGATVREVQDATLDSGYSGTLPADTRYRFGKKAGSATNKTILRYDLTELAGTYDSIDSVTLRLGNSGGSLGTEILNLKIYSISASNAGWQETSANWAYLNVNTLTPWAGSAGLNTSGVDFDAEPLASIQFNPVTFVHGTFTTVSLPTSLIEQWITGTNAGILIACETLPVNTYGTFYASDGQRWDYAPRLTIEFTPIPEPATMTIISVGLIGLMLRRKG